MAFVAWTEECRAFAYDELPKDVALFARLIQDHDSAHARVTHKEWDDEKRSSHIKFKALHYTLVVYFKNGGEYDCWYLTDEVEKENSGDMDRGDKEKGYARFKGALEAYGSYQEAWSRMYDCLRGNV